MSPAAVKCTRVRGRGSRGCRSQHQDPQRDHADNGPPRHRMAFKVRGEPGERHYPFGSFEPTAARSDRARTIRVRDASRPPSPDGQGSGDMYISLRRQPLRDCAAGGSGVPHSRHAGFRQPAHRRLFRGGHGCHAPLRHAGLGLSVFAYSVVDGLHQGAARSCVFRPRSPPTTWTGRNGSPSSGYGVSAVYEGRPAASERPRRACGRRRGGPGRQGDPHGAPGQPGRARLRAPPARPRLRGPPGAGHDRRLPGPVLAFGVLQLLPGRFSAVFVVSLAFAVVGSSARPPRGPDLRRADVSASGPGAPRPARVPWREVASAPVRRLLVGAPS